ncbi:MAG: hypothetical protein GY755_07940 [Chloroflexi bacterium]|nr:hypothetical protein [Chloroflexota bacterium]
MTSFSDEFDRLVRTHYKFLCDEYGFEIEKVKDEHYVAKTENVKVYIELERGINFVVGIEPTGESANSLLRQNILPRRIGVVIVAQYYDSDFDYKSERIFEKRFISNLPNKLERWSLVLQKYCIEMLDGDFSDYDSIIKKATESWNKKHGTQ